MVRTFAHPSSAIARITNTGLTLAQAAFMEDNELLVHNSIGRKTLNFIRLPQLVDDPCDDCSHWAGHKL